jgi:hypothetical protein
LERYKKPLESELEVDCAVETPDNEHGATLQYNSTLSLPLSRFSFSLSLSLFFFSFLATYFIAKAIVCDDIEVV